MKVHDPSSSNIDLMAVRPRIKPYLPIIAIHQNVKYLFIMDQRNEKFYSKNFHMIVNMRYING